MQELIDDLENGGIRFVYFSPYSESITKAFGDRLGLETDWNSCIILSHNSGSSGEVEFTDPKSKLPRGVFNIRPHLLDVDDIPLHISLFAECDAQSVSEMLSIYKENEEVVVAIGSTLNWSNAQVFASSALPIGMEPTNLSIHTRKGRPSNIYLSSRITGLLCPIVLPFDCSPYVLTELIREARRLLRANIAASYYRKSFTTCLLILFITPGFGGDMFLYSSIIGIGLIVTFLLLPYEPEIMKRMPIKMPSSGDQFNMSQAVHFGIRTVINTIFMYIASRMSSLACVTVVIFSCLSYYHTRLSLLEYFPFDFMFNSRKAIVLLFPLLISISIIQGVLRALLSFTVGLTSLLMNEVIKYWWRQEADRSEKRMKLQFNTKLGMHSPI